VTNADPSSDTSSRLVGWKRIAAHLSCSERTARRWEAEENLPVHRQVHEAKSTVYAFPAELDRWIASRGTGAPAEGPDNSKKEGGGSRLALIIAGIVIVILLAVNISGYLSGREQVEASGPPLSEDALALDLYERGMALWEQRGEDANRRAIQNFRAAVERDPDFSEAWAALASAYGTLPTYTDEVDLEESLDQALLAADRALRLDPELVQPRTLMGEIAERRGEWPLAREIFEDAMASDPDNATITLWAAGHFREAGYLNRSLELTDLALELEPGAPPALNERAMTHFFFGDAARGEEELNFLWNELGFDTPIIWYAKWFAYLRRGDFAALEDWQSQCPFASGCELFMLGAAAAQGSDEDRAAFSEHLLEAYEDGAPAFMIVSLMQVSGNMDAILDVADSETNAQRFVNFVVLFDPVIAEIRRSPRFTGIVDRVGLLTYWQETGPPDFCAEEPEAHVCQQLQQEQVN
jgi:cytochrome c-type biogenesis protein CcmH/NrfG